MPLPVRTALLAVAALAAVAFATVRITHAHRTIEREPERPQRTVTPAQAAATLAKLHTPPGFRQVTPCRFKLPYQKCFWTPRALALDVHVAQRISAAEGTRAVGIPLISGCSGPIRGKGGGPVRRICNWDLELGPELVYVSADSVSFPPGPPRTPKARKARREIFRYSRLGTEVRMAVIGHWPGGKPPATECPGSEPIPTC